jgi:uncharacterized protein YkwD
MDRLRHPLSLLTALLSCAALLLPAGAASAASSSRCANTTLIPDRTNTAQIRRATRCLINRERRRFGRKPLAANSTLNVPAQAYAQQMARENFFDHVSPTGSTLLKRVKGLTNYLTGRIARWSVGENLAWGSQQLGSPVAIVRSWMNSPSHRHNILNPGFRDIGIGVVAGAPEDVGGDPAGTYTTVFGQRSSG